MKRFEIVKSSEFPEYDLKVTLKPCFRCNHNCWFCDEYDNKAHVWSKNECDIVLDKLKSIPVNKQKIFFYLYGGEPTLSKHWEYIQYQLVEIFKDRELYIQTQTNLSIDPDRLDQFLGKINKIKHNNKHTIDICSSYHLGKQKVEDFIGKMDICQRHNVLGLCFFSTEIPKEDLFLADFSMIAASYPDKLKLKFTIIPNLKYKKLPGYESVLNDSFLVGTDNGEHLEYRYFMRKYPEMKRYLEEGWNFNIDGVIKNYCNVVGDGDNKQFKYMKCQCGTKGVVIDHNLKVYHCNDDYESQINITELGDINFNQYLKRDVMCLNRWCYDGLDYIKYK